MNHRTPTPKSKYWVEPRKYKFVMSWCECYPLWKKELETLPDGNRGIDYSKDKVQSSGNFDSTYETAVKRVDLEQKVNILETTAKLVTDDLTEWLIKGTTEDLTADDLVSMGMPCSKSLYYQIRQKFYYQLSKRV